MSGQISVLASGLQRCLHHVCVQQRPAGTSSLTSAGVVFTRATPPAPSEGLGGQRYRELCELPSDMEVEDFAPDELVE